jgi:hypothetical protein
MGIARSRSLMISAVLAVAVIVLTATPDRMAASQAGAGNTKVVWGTWALALDSTPFGIPGGFLSPEWAWPYLRPILVQHIRSVQ